MSYASMPSAVHTNGCECIVCQFEMFLMRPHIQRLLTRHHIHCESNSDHLIDLPYDESRCDCGAVKRADEIKRLLSLKENQ